MKYWNDLSMEERRAAIMKHGAAKVDAVAKACFFATAELVQDDEVAVQMVWRIPVNDFLINTPEEVAEHCRKLAAIEKRNSHLQEALAICRQRLEERHGPGMAMDIRNDSIDEDGFHFSYKLWNKRERQQICVMYSDLPTTTE